jgi:histidinol-phosphate aminotransferase
VNADLRSLIRPHIREMPPYEPILPFDVLSQKLGIPQERIVKLDANENPFGPLPEVRQALSHLDQVHIYPDPESRRIRGLLADYHEIPIDSLVMGAGADELIDLIMRLTVGPGDRLINCPPTFGMYAFDGAINGAEVIEVPRRPDFAIDLEKLLAQVEAKAPKLLFLAHPNNPDGGLAPQDTIELLVNQPLLIVLDEAYINFSPEGSSWIQRVADYDNLIVLRTFSKWAGLAGLRVGYGVFPEWLTPLLMKAKQPYNVSIAAEAAACAAMDHVQQLNGNAGRIVSERGRLMRGLMEIPWISTYASTANFVLCRVIGRNAGQVKRQLMEQGILIRYFNKPGLHDHIRISIGKPEHNDILIEALTAME